MSDGIRSRVTIANSAQRSIGRVRQAGAALIGPLVIIAVWAVATNLRLVPSLLMPTPQDAFARLATLLWTGDIGPDIRASLWRWLSGYTLACVLGVPLGLLLGGNLVLYRATFPMVDFLRSLPVTALFPLFLLLFGIGDHAKIAMAFAASVFVVVLNSAHGVLTAQKTRVRAARAFGATDWQIFKWVTFFEALPQTLVGMRTALSLALIAVIVSEMFIGTQKGLGQRVFDAYTVNLTVDLYAVLLFCGFLGYVVNRGFQAVEMRIVFWTGR
jgi:NitT/TauT family transport system permease protein